MAQVLVPPHGPTIAALTLRGVAWEIGGAGVVGAAIGGLVALYLRVLRRELFLFAIVVAFFGSEIARLCHVEPLLTLIVAGFVAQNVSVSAHADALRHAMERAAEPVFVVFFALAGADIVLPDLARFWPLVLPLAAVRGASIWAGTRLGIRWARLTGNEGDMLRRHAWTALIPAGGCRDWIGGDRGGDLPGPRRADSHAVPRAGRAQSARRSNSLSARAGAEWRDPKHELRTTQKPSPS